MQTVFNDNFNDLISPHNCVCGEVSSFCYGNGTQCFEYTYDFQGRRISKKEFNNNTLTKHIKFVYDGFKLITEFDVLNSDELMAKYLWAEDNLLTLIKDNASYYYMVDGNKNIVGLVDETATKVNTYEYTPFGKLSLDNETIAQPFKFSSEYFDNETNLCYYNYRYYNPETGKWLKRDPIGEVGGLNIYGFVNNNSLSYYDNLGADPVSRWIWNWAQPKLDEMFWGKDKDYNAMSNDEYFQYIKHGRWKDAYKVATGANFKSYGSLIKSSSVSDKVLSHLKSVITYIPETSIKLVSKDIDLFTIPHPSITNKVTLSISGTADKCKNDDGSFGAIAKINISITAHIGIGKSIQVSDKLSKVSANYNSGDCNKCENSITGSFTVKAGAKAGFIIGAEVYSQGTFGFGTKPKFKAGYSFGKNGTVGAEIYAEATGSFEGQLVVINPGKK